MIAANNPELDVEQLMRRIREEVARQPATVAAPAASARPGNAAPLLAAVTIPPLNPPPKTNAFAPKSIYALRDFLDQHDENFIVSVYRGVLKREPDPDGLNHFLGKLRNGDYSQIEIVGRLRFSPEGRKAGVRIKGLWLPFAVQTVSRAPLLGYVIAWVNGLVRLPVMLKNRQRFEAHTAFLISQQQQAVGQRIEQINQTFEQMQRQIGSLAEGKANQTELGDIREQMQHLTAVKASQQQLTEMQQQMQEALAQTASQQQLTEMQQQMQEALAHTASQQQQHLDEVQQQMQQQMQEALAQTASQHHQQIAEVQQRMQEALAQTASQQQRLDEVQQQMQEALAQTASQQQQHQAEAKDAFGEIRRQIFDHKRTILDQQRRLALLLEETRKRLPAPLDREQLTVVLDEDEHLLDAMYATFEDQFRGTREDIRNRQRVYIPLIQDCQAGTLDAPVLDVGCGRGEWLELLRDHQLIGHGVDLNRVFIQQCREVDLAVIEQDAVAYLRSLPNHSLGAITGFHIIEHLPTRILIALLDEALRVLRPGGIVIFETPNPGNLLVGSCNFYMDPTHRNPLPASLSHYLVEARGFVRARIIELHPYDATHLINDGPPQWVQMLNQRFFGPQDYAVVACKA